MAFSRREMARRWQGRNPARMAFATSMKEALRQAFRAQPNSRYRLTEAVVDEVGYLSKGEFVWVLMYNSVSHNVSWVSSDFFIYDNPASDFDLGDDALAALLKPGRSDG